MAVTSEHRNWVADAVANAIEEVYLVDDADEQIGDAQPATFTGAGDRAELSESIDFSIPADTTVKGWRASGDDTDFGGFDFDEPETFSNEGIATLEAGDTYFSYEEVSD